MDRRRRHIPYIRPKYRPLQARSTFILLDQFSIDDIQKWAAFKDQLLKYHWDYYSESGVLNSIINLKEPEKLQDKEKRIKNF